MCADGGALSEKPKKAMKEKLFNLFFVLIGVVVLLLGVTAAMAVTHYACQHIGRWAGILFAVSVSGGILLLAIILFASRRNKR